MQPGVAPNKPAIQKKDTTTKLEAVPAPTHGGRMFGQKKPSVSAVGFWKGGKIHPPKNTQTIDTVYFLTVFLFVGFTVWGPQILWEKSPHPKKRCFRSHPQTFPPKKMLPGWVRSSNQKSQTRTHKRRMLAREDFGWIFFHLSFGCFRKKKQTPFDFQQFIAESLVEVFHI